MAIILLVKPNGEITQMCFGLPVKIRLTAVASLLSIYRIDVQKRIKLALILNKASRSHSVLTRIHPTGKTLDLFNWNIVVFFVLKLPY